MDELPGTRPLARTVIALAGTPEEFPVVQTLLERIAQLAVDRIPAVSYASITAPRDDGHTTVAVSNELIRAVDEVQYTDGGPCVQAVQQGEPVAVPEIRATVLWPDFAAQAHRLGLQASLSVPLFAAAAGGSGVIAALNLFAHDPGAMAPLSTAVYALYRSRRFLSESTLDLPELDAGGEELLDGLTEAMIVRGQIQRAIQIIMVRDGCTKHEAYLQLLATATLTARSFQQVAADLLPGH